MIHNSRQAGIARKKHQELMLAASRAKPGQGSSFLALAEDIANELAEYEAIRDGHITTFAVNGVDDIGEALVKARIARGLTHRQLSETLGVSEQMIQRDEGRSYENAGLARVAEVADALDYELVGSLRPVQPVAVTMLGSAPTSTTWAIGSSSASAINTVIASGTTLIMAGALPNYMNMSGFNTPPWVPVARNLALDSNFFVFGSPFHASFPRSTTVSLRGNEDSSATVKFQDSEAMR